MVEISNTKYFYAAIKHKRLQQATTHIKNDYSDWKYDPKNILHNVALFTTDQHIDEASHREGC